MPKASRMKRRRASWSWETLGLAGNRAEAVGKSPKGGRCLEKCLDFACTVSQYCNEYSQLNMEVSLTKDDVIQFGSFADCVSAGQLFVDLWSLSQ